MHLREPGARDCGTWWRRARGRVKCCRGGEGPLHAPPPPRMTSQGLSFQLRQGSVGRGPEGHDELRIPGAQSGRLIEMERSVSVDCCAVGMRRGGPRGLAPADPPTPFPAECNAGGREGGFAGAAPAPGGAAGQPAGPGPGAPPAESAGPGAQQPPAGG